MPAWITSGKEVKAAVADGWELWHVSRDPLPGHWELRRGREVRRVHWDAIGTVRRHYLDWFEENTEALQAGLYTWAYVPRQRRLTLTTTVKGEAA